MITAVVNTNSAFRYNYWYRNDYIAFLPPAQIMQSYIAAIL